MKQEEEKRGITSLDIRIVVSALLCCLTATVLNHFQFKFTYGEMHLEIIQKMTSCIACLLCCQDNLSISKKAGLNRLIITFIGGLAAVLVVLIDNALGKEWLFVVMTALGLLLTLLLCKAARVPYINARIGGVTFILVACTLTENARIFYALFRFISTLYGVAVVLLVTWLWQLAEKHLCNS